MAVKRNQISVISLAVICSKVQWCYDVILYVRSKKQTLVFSFCNILGSGANNSNSSVTFRRNKFIGQ